MQTLLYSVFPVIIHTRKLIILLRMGAFIIFSHCLMWSSPYLGPINTLHTCSLITLFRNTFIIVGGMHGRAWICGCLKWVQRKTPSTPSSRVPTAKTENWGQMKETHFVFLCARVCAHVLICSEKNPMMPVKSLISLKQSLGAQMIAIYFSFPLAKQKWAP